MAVAVFGSPALGDQSTDTLDSSPELLEVMTDFVNPMLQAEFEGLTLKVGSVTALFDPPMVKSEVLVEEEEETRGQLSGLTTSFMSLSSSSSPPAAIPFNTHVNSLSEFDVGAISTV